MRILVVDDEPAVRESLKRSLRFEGYEVVVATDGAEALERVRDDRPDPLALDVLMPRVDGLETCRRLRARGDDLPVLLLTAKDAIADRVNGLGLAQPGWDEADPWSPPATLPARLGTSRGHTALRRQVRPEEDTRFLPRPDAADRPRC
jgi:CheY-like chemotaxis protein